jgi:hypothetical protein
MVEVGRFAYLSDALERVCTHPARRVVEFLPDRGKNHLALEVSRPE